MCMLLLTVMFLLFFIMLETNSFKNIIFSTLHRMQTWSSDENSVGPSVSQLCASCQNERKVCPEFIPCEWSFSLVLRAEEWLVGGVDPFYLKFWVDHPRWSEIADFEPMFACSASALTPSKKSSINTNRKYTTHFPMSLRWSSYIAAKLPKGGHKTQNGQLHHSGWRWTYNVRKILSASSSLPLLANTNAPCSAVSLR